MNKERKLSYSIIAITLVTTTLSFLVISNSKTAGGNYSQKLIKFNQDIANCNLPDPENNVKPYKCYQKILKSNVGVVPYNVLMEDIEGNNPVGTLKGYCHNTLHDLGRIYYEEIDGNTKLTTLCGDALFHGVIQEASHRGDDSKITRLLESSCKDSSGNYSDVCIHGIGHVLWESTGDLKQFMSKCISSTKLTVPSYEFYILTCVDGYLMKASKNTVLKPDVEFVAADTIEVSKKELEKMFAECESYESNLALGCKGLLFRWYYPNYLKNAKNSNFTDYSFMERNCIPITDLQARDLCIRQTGIMAYDYMIYYEDYTYNPVSKFCSEEMLVGCLDAYFEHYIDFPAQYIKVHSMDNFDTFSTKVCNSIMNRFKANECRMRADVRKKMATA